TSLSIGGGVMPSTRGGLIQVGKEFREAGVSLNTNWRIDHVTLNLTGRGITTKGRSYGLIDHCNFDAAIKGNQQGVTVIGDDAASWNRPLSLGTTECVC